MARAKKLDTIIKCNSCESDKIVIEFYKTNNKFISNNGYFPVCKKCLKERYDDLIKLYDGDYMEALIHLTLNMDFPFDLNEAERVIDEDSPTNTLEDYFNSMIRSFGRKSTKTNTEDNITNIKEYRNKDEENIDVFDDVLKNFKITKDVYRRWGTGYTKEELFLLEETYNELVDTYGGTLPTEKSLYKDYALNEIRKKQALDDEKDDVYMKYQKAQSTLMSDARLKPTQDRSADSDDVLVGMFIKNIEENKPIPEVDEKFKDVDGIRKIINEEFIGTLSRSIGGVIK